VLEEVKLSRIEFDTTSGELVSQLIIISTLVMQYWQPTAALRNNLHSRRHH
jgi:hypothetical protein